MKAVPGLALLHEYEWHVAQIRVLHSTAHGVA